MIGDEEARAAAYREQAKNRVKAIDAREKSLAGSDAAAQALHTNWNPLIEAETELAPEGNYDGRFPDQRN